MRLPPERPDHGRRGAAGSALFGLDIVRPDQVIAVPRACPHFDDMEHAPLKPLSCTAPVQADRVDLWLGTQTQKSTREAAADLTGLSLDQACVHTTLLGGGFGRCGELDVPTQVIKLSMAVGGPVKVQWTREECFLVECAHALGQHPAALRPTLLAGASRQLGG